MTHHHVPHRRISGIGSGFGHHENQYTLATDVHDGKLYIGTFDTSSLLEPIGQFSNGDIIGMTPEEWGPRCSTSGVCWNCCTKRTTPSRWPCLRNAGYAGDRNPGNGYVYG